MTLLEFSQRLHFIYTFHSIVEDFLVIEIRSSNNQSIFWSICRSPWVEITNLLSKSNLSFSCWSPFKTLFGCRSMCRMMISFTYVVISSISIYQSFCRILKPSWSSSNSWVFKHWCLSKLLIIDYVFYHQNDDNTSILHLHPFINQHRLGNVGIFANPHEALQCLHTIWILVGLQVPNSKLFKISSTQLGECQ